MILKPSISRLVGPFFPWTRIAHGATANAIAGSTKLFGQILYWNLLQKLIPIRPTKDVYLLYRDFIQPRFNDGPYSAERPRRIDDIKLAHRLRISVLADGGGLHDVVLDAIKTSERDAS